MNKKVLTLCAGLLLAGNVVALAQTIDVSTADYQVGTSPYKIYTAGGTWNQFTIDNSKIAGRSAFPNVSPFVISVKNGAMPIAALENVSAQKAEDRYFQFVVSESRTGKHVLTMVWVSEGANSQGHYEVQIENVENANFSGNPIKLDRTLWKVTAHKDAAGTTLYYELQNKATDAILQLATDPKEVDPSNADFYEADIKIVAGQTDWRWAKGEAASVTSTVDPTAGKVLVDELSAQFSNGKTLYLAKKVKGSKISLGAVVGNSNTAFSSTSISGATFTPIKFEAWEANPILLTAEQINAELGNDLYDDGKSDGKFHFTFAPDVVGDENVMTAYNFVAKAAEEATTRKPGDAPDHFVRFESKEKAGQFLMVDTTYYNEAAQDRYELKMAVREITLPRHAVVKDDKEVSTIQGLVNSGDAYVAPYATAPLYSVAAYTQMKRQSNFLPVFYPATSSLKLQAEMIYKKAKTNEPWWYQVKEAIDSSTGNMALSAYALNNGANPLAGATASTPVNAVGYYPAYTDKTTNAAAAQNLQKLSYETVYKIPVPGATNGYLRAGKPVAGNNKWNAIPTLNLNSSATSNQVPSVGLAVSKDMQVIDPTSAVTSGNVNASTSKIQIIPSVNFLNSNSNVVKLVTLTADHKVLTTDIADPNDTKFNGLLTNISIDGLRQNGNLSEVVDIEEGFYYIQNANKKASQLNKYGDYRYEDLAATNAMFTYWNNVTETWDRGVSALDGNGAQDRDNTGLNEATHGDDNANIGNLVYSSEKLTIPSAQWYIKGNGDHYVMINRESGRQWGTEYWWKTSEEGVYVNQATYTDAAGQLQTYRDTIRLTPVPAAELTDQYLGYLNLTPKEAIADTCVYNIGMNNLGEVRFSLSADENGILKMVQDAQGDYKLERVLTEDVDPYVSGDAAKKYTDDLIYGFAPMAGGEIDSSKMLHRAKYYIYKDEVSANSGIEESSVKTRHYITLSEGQYRLTPVEVKFKKVGDDLYSFNTEVNEIPGTDNVKYRRAFFVKQMTADANNFVLVDPEVVTTTNNGTSTKTAYGARVFVNQLSAGLQPGSLISDGYANSFANSVLNFAKVAKQNYADIRRAGMDRDTVQFYVAGNASYMLGENSNVKGANVGLLDLRAVSDKINNAIFVDTANVHNSACPRFLLGLRDVDTYEVSNIDSHNKHLYTDAAYLVNLIDSAKTNNAYKYTNAGVNAIEYYRLGFLNGRHEGSVLTLDESKKKFYLSDDALGETGLNYATFAFRYVDTDRENFYIETMYDNANKGWLKIHNGVAVVTPEIQEAEVFSFDAVQKEATANEEIAASSVVVAGTNGAVVVKGAEGKSVIVSTILGKVVANEVLTSDNAQITAPAGVVVVSVDGESFKVVVK